MDKFLEKYNHPKLNQDYISYINRFTANNEIEAAIKSPPKFLGCERFTAEFYQTFKEELIPIFLKHFHEIKREGTLPNTFYETSIYSYQRRTRIQKKLELQVILIEAQSAFDKIQHIFMIKALKKL
jgi:hypothetical protein